MGGQRLNDVVGGFFEDVLLFRDRLHFAVGGNGGGPLGEVVLRAGEEEISTGDVGGLGGGFDKGFGQFDGLVVALVVVRLDDFLGSLRALLGRERGERDSQKSRKQDSKGNHLVQG